MINIRGRKCTLKSYLNVCAVLTLCVLYLNVQNNIHRKNTKESFQQLDPEKKPFTILFWTGEFGEDAAKMYYKPECAHEFRLTSNRSLHDSADVIVFFYVDLRSGNVELPPKRNPNIPWGLALHEASINYGLLNTSIFNGIFNFTWTFRTDSEVHPIFDEMVSKYEYASKNWDYGGEFTSNFLKKKTKMAAWAVSNCNIQPSKRNELVKSLASHGIQIDIFGSCGNNVCDRNTQCFDKLGEKYKFYMALENSLCVDYITEKIYHGLLHNMVPIVYALGDVENYAPAGSFINVMQYETVEELANEIKFLDGNPKEYLKYFEWRNTYNITNIHNNPQYTCHNWRMMKKFATEIGKNQKNKLYADLETWHYYFYNNNLQKFCPNCVSKDKVDVTNPRNNLYKIYGDDSNSCKDFIPS